MNEDFRKVAPPHQGDNEGYVVVYMAPKPQGHGVTKVRQHGGQTGPSQQGRKIVRSDWDPTPTVQMG